ncbi:MAG: PKD domain-containing protein [Bacteroidetes bacterium]|nr:PKD domain-containing protein [Bacteroidota bacterium]
MWRKPGWIWLLVSASAGLLRAQCTITAGRSACVNDLVPFGISVGSGTATNWSWSFGGQGSSSNTAPLFKFTSSGAVLVSCTVTYTGGSSCTDTHSIYILPSPVASLAYDTTSRICLKNNLICVQNKSQKATRGLKQASLLWGDGNIDQYKQPFTSKWCHTFPDTGSFKLSLELADSAGCKDVYSMTVFIAPSVALKLHDTLFPGCDSSKACFTATYSGGKTFTEQWKLLAGSYAGTPKSPFCAWVKGGGTLGFKLKVTNEYGCRDSANATVMAPDSSMKISMGNKVFCSAAAKAGGLVFSNGYDVLWELNGVKYYTSSSFVAKNVKPGLNILKAYRGGTCPKTFIDTFYIREIVAKGRIANEFRTGVGDTAFFMDVSQNHPGSRIYRLWHFNDNYAAGCTTFTKKKLYTGTNCNFSRDSLAWHVYSQPGCYQVRLYIYDTTTGCSADTTFTINRREFCNNLIIKDKVCLGDFEQFQILAGHSRKIGLRNYLYTDLVQPRDSLLLRKGLTTYYYKTPGFKSPVFWRFLGPDTVWTFKNNKLVIDYINPAKGWVGDTLFNAIKVVYKPDAAFTLQRLSVCNPNKVRLNWKAASWLYPQKLTINWGDSVTTITGFTDTIALLKAFEHVYKKPGLYTVRATLITTLGACPGDFSETVGFGQIARFGYTSACGGLVCFRDSVFDSDSMVRWTRKNGYGTLRWEFGDGYTDTGYQVCHRYAGGGKYKVKLISTALKGCVDTFSLLVNVSMPIAAIKYQPTLYCSEIRQYFDSSWISGTAPITLTGWKWNFGDGSPTVYVQNPAHIFPTGGVYTVRLIVEADNGCKDTAYRNMTVLGPEIKAMIDSDSAGCAPLLVKFKNLSRNTKNFIWEFGDPDNTFYSTNQDTGVAFRYKKPGVYYAHITGGDSFSNPTTGSKYYCSVRYPQPGLPQLRITVYGGGHAAFTAPDTLCLQDTVVFENGSDASVAWYKWYFGNGDSATRRVDTFSYQYKKPGTYRVMLHAIVANVPAKNCYDTAVKNILVLGSNPTFELDCGGSRPPEYTFRNTGPDVNYRWTLKDTLANTEKLLSTTRDLLWDFGADTGTRRICLRINAGKFCREPACSSVRLAKGVYLANVFTPGADGFNDAYKVPIYGYQDFEVRIFNRWGERVFHSTDPNYQWNGKVNNTGVELPSSTYFYQVQFRRPCDSKLQEVHGSVNLIR